MDVFSILDKINIKYYHLSGGYVMDFIKLLSLPEIIFSHFYKADSYRNRFSVKENFLEISYIADGEIDLKIGGDTFCAKKGDVICFFHNKDTCVSAKNFHCHHTVGTLTEWDITDNEKNDLFLPVVTPAEYNTAPICRLIDGIIYNQVTYKTVKAAGASEFLKLICEIDSCNRKRHNFSLQGQTLYAAKAKDYIQKNIHSPITQKSVAEYLGISPEYLCSVFKSSEGTTLIRYINKIKLENIKALLDNTNLRLYEAAAVYGYTDPNYVSRLYKQLFGYNITDKPLIHPTIR